MAGASDADGDRVMVAPQEPAATATAGASPGKRRAAEREASDDDMPDEPTTKDLFRLLRSAVGDLSDIKAKQTEQFNDMARLDNKMDRVERDGKQTRTEMQELRTRVADLERKPAASSAASGSAGSTAAPSSPRLPGDPWMQWRSPGRQATQPSAASPGRPRASPVRSASSARQAETPREQHQEFIPGSVSLKGRANYNSGRGITQEEGRMLGERVKALLPGPLRDCVGTPSSPYVCNRQVLLPVSGGKEKCWEVRNSLAALLKETPINVLGKPCFPQVMQSPWVRKRTAATAKAMAALECQLKDEDRDRVKVCFRANTIYHDSSLSEALQVSALGKLSQHGDFRWTVEKVKEKFGYIDTDKLVEDTVREE